MAAKPSLPASLFRTYTSLLARRTSHLQSQTSQVLGLELRSQAQAAWRQYVAGAKPQLIPIPVRAPTGFGQRRWHSTDFQQTKKYDFEDVRIMSSLTYAQSCGMCRLTTRLGSCHPRNPLLVPPHYRRARATRICNEQHSNRDQHSRVVATRCAVAERRRIPG
jgi:hypothetical protein